MKLRPYQNRCLEAALTGFHQYRSQLVVMATGCGKTVLFAHLAHQWPTGRVLVLVHREELARQAADKIQQITGDQPGIEMGADRVYETDDDFVPKDRIIVASVQTLTRPKRLAKFRPAEFGLIITDEAHHACAASYGKIYDHFEHAKHLGVTATPKRSDEMALGKVFEHCCFDYGIEPAIGDGWLVPVRQRVVKVEGLDFSNVRTVAGDLNEGDLERILTEEKPLHGVALPTIEMAGDKPALVFCVSVNHAKLMTALLNRYKGGSAAFLSGETPKEERQKIVAAYKRGEVQFLTNCMLFVEGFDAPNTALVVMARPTKSLSLYIQVLGRGTRPLPGVVDAFADGTPEQRKAAIAASLKSHMTVLDFAGNAGRHKIVTAADVLGGRYEEPVRQYAAKTNAEEGQASPVTEALERAEAELALLAEESRRKQIRAKASYQVEEVSPFDRADVQPDFEADSPVRGDPASDKQVRYLCYLGVSEAKARTFTKKQASLFINKLREKQAV